MVGHMQLHPTLCFPVDLILGGWITSWGGNGQWQLCISNNIQTPGPRIQSPLHAALELSKQHFMLLYFPLSTLYFNSHVPLLQFAECLCPGHSFYLEYSPSSWDFSVKILPILQGLHSPWNLPNVRYSVLTLNSGSTFFETPHMTFTSFCFVLYGVSTYAIACTSYTFLKVRIWV